MAKKTTTPPSTPKPVPAKKTADAPASTPVRNTPVPKAAKVAKPVAAAATAAAPATKVITEDQIAARAYELYQRGVPGSEADHWHQAERELRAV